MSYIWMGVKLIALLAAVATLLFVLLITGIFNVLF